MRKIPLLKPYFDQDEVEELQSVLDSGWVAQGPKVKEFEEKISEYIGIKHTIALSNCTCALHLALLSAGIGRGDEVLVGDYTYPATGHSVVYCGAKPVFVDVDLATYNIDPSKIADLITERTKAIIPIHTFGNPCQMDEILKIAQENDLKVIEDAACALGAKYKDRFAGTIGDIGCFSLHARKGITTGEGGLASTNDTLVAEKIRKLSVFGIETAWKREGSDEFVIPRFTEFGYNYKLSDISAAVGVAQMRKIDAIIQRKRELARYWDEKLDSMDDIEPPKAHDDVLHIYQSYVPLVGKGINRNRLIQKLADKGIGTQIGTYSSFIQPVYCSDNLCPVSKEVYDRAIALPMYYELSEEQIDVASKAMTKILREIK